MCGVRVRKGLPIGILALWSCNFTNSADNPLPMNRAAYICVALTLGAVLATSGCRNVPAEEREQLRYTVQAAGPDDRDNVRAELRLTLVGDATRPRSGDPHLRAAAAQGLGDLGDPADAELLLDVLMGPLSDSSMQVRLESAIALGKLHYGGRADPLQRIVILSLRDRIAFDRDDSGRPFETEYMVRNAMLNSLIALGGRAGANAIHDIATRLYSDLQATGGALFTGATDKGLLDRCFEGLGTITGVSRREAAAHRVANDDLDEHLSWWAEQIRLMDQ
jgi:HEAT repeat protein